MRKYLWMATIISVTTVYVCADDNPFNLKENLQKIDRDQDFLLSAFQDIVDKKEKLDELNLDEADEVMAIDKDEKIINDLNVSSEDIDTVKEVAQGNISKDKSVEKQIVKKEEKNIQEEKEEKIKQEKLRDKKEKEELKRLEKVKLEQLKIEEERKKQEKEKQEKEKQEKAKKDKLEALHIEKLKKEKEKPEEKEKQEEEEKQEAKPKKVELKKVSKLENPKQVKQKVEIEQVSSEAIVDINITQEKLIATEEADKVYLEAVKEMDED
ncbi:MAG TPA: hypothetical protein EYH42_09090 [Sulfurovum sp.]|nr:hypothetical protein [Sulfurovum sp.]